MGILLRQHGGRMTVVSQPVCGSLQLRPQGVDARRCSCVRSQFVSSNHSECGGGDKIAATRKLSRHGSCRRRSAAHSPLRARRPASIRSMRLRLTPAPITVSAKRCSSMNHSPPLRAPLEPSVHAHCTGFFNLLQQRVGVAVEGVGKRASLERGVETGAGGTATRARGRNRHLPYAVAAKCGGAG